MDRFFGNGVFHCPYCDGWEVRDRPLAAYGVGRTALASRSPSGPGARTLPCSPMAPRALLRRTRIGSPATEFRFVRRKSHAWRAARVWSRSCFGMARPCPPRVFSANEPKFGGGRLQHGVSRVASALQVRRKLQHQSCPHKLPAGGRGPPSRHNMGSESPVPEKRSMPSTSGTLYDTHHGREQRRRFPSPRESIRSALPRPARATRYPCGSRSRSGGHSRARFTEVRRDGRRRRLRMTVEGPGGVVAVMAVVAEDTRRRRRRGWSPALRPGRSAAHDNDVVHEGSLAADAVMGECGRARQRFEADVNRHVHVRLNLLPCSSTLAHHRVRC